MKTTSTATSFDKEIVGSEGADYLLGTEGDDLARVDLVDASQVIA